MEVYSLAKIASSKRAGWRRVEHSAVVVPRSLVIATFLASMEPQVPTLSAYLGRELVPYVTGVAKSNDASFHLFMDPRLVLKVSVLEAAGFINDAPVPRAAFLEAVLAAGVRKSLEEGVFPTSHLCLLQAPPGRLQKDGGYLLHIDGELPFHGLHERTEELQHLLQWAEGLPILSLLFAHCGGRQVLLEGSSLNLKLVNVSGADLPSMLEMRDAIARELESATGKVFLQTIARRVFRVTEGVGRADLVSFFTDRNELSMPPKIDPSPPPLWGHVFLSIYEVPPGSKSALTLCKLLASSLKLWRRAQWPGKNFRLATVCDGRPLSLARVIGRPKVVTLRTKHCVILSGSPPCRASPADSHALMLRSVGFLGCVKGFS